LANGRSSGMSSLIGANMLALDHMVSPGSDNDHAMYSFAAAGCGASAAIASICGTPTAGVGYTHCNGAPFSHASPATVVSISRPTAMLPEDRRCTRGVMLSNTTGSN